VDEAMYDRKMLKLVLQPFVENALLHGLHVLKDHINLIISVEREEGTLVWKVIDDGVGIPQDQIPRLDEDDSAQAGYGIANVHRRIRMYFGEEYGVTIWSEEGVGTAVMIRMPLMEKKSGEG
jgi:sensor histidine kinase YesM